MLQVVREKEISRPGRSGNTRKQLLSEDPWLYVGKNWRVSWSREKNGLIQVDTHSILRMWTLSKGKRTQGMGLWVAMGSSPADQTHCLEPRASLWLGMSHSCYLSHQSSLLWTPSSEEWSHRHCLIADSLVSTQCPHWWSHLTKHVK